MFKIITIIRDTKRLVDIANRERVKNAGEPAFAFWLTNRSFLVPTITLLINILITLNLPFLVPLVQLITSVSPDFIAENIVEVTMGFALIWSFFERVFAKGITIWNRDQGVKAVEEAVTVKHVERDRLQEALDQALKLPVKVKR